MNYKERLLAAANIVLASDQRASDSPVDCSEIGVTATMKPHQVEGVSWLIRRFELGVNAVLGDEMGLGKTLQAISLLSYLKFQRNSPGPFLVLCPLSVTDGWVSEIAKFSPKLKVLSYVGNKEHRRTLRKTMWEDVKRLSSVPHVSLLPFDVLLTTYDIALMDQDFLCQIQWHYAIVDEAQRLKNPSSVLYNVLTDRFLIPRRLLMTGTPVQNNLTELWALMHFCMPLVFGTLEQFLSTFKEAGDTGEHSRPSGVKEQLKSLKHVLQAFMLRRTKSKLIESGDLALPPLTQITVMVPLVSLQKKVHASLLRKELPKLLALSSGNSNQQSLQNIGEYNCMILRDLLGDGIFAVDGDKWRQQRKVSSYEFSTKVLRDFSSLVFRKNVVKLANILSEVANATQILDIQDLFMRSTLDSIFKVAFGVELDSMCGSSAQGKEFSKAFDDSSEATLFRYVDIFWKIKRFLNLGSEAALKKNIEVIDRFVYKLIHNKIEQLHDAKDDSSVKKDDILSRFLQVSDTDPTYLRDIILNFIIAGKDTTATTLAWFIYMLCKRPAAQERVAKEVDEATDMQGAKNITAFTANLSEEALEKMQYLHAAITETLRLYPALPVDAKVCLSDDKLPDGFDVRKGDMVAYQPYAMGRMQRIWGDDAEAFKPERWLNEDGLFRPESPFKFTAFQAGPRICLGREFAYRQMKIFSAVLLHFFVFKLSDEDRSVTYRTMINLHIDGGLHVRVSHRSRN